ncbi:MAG TPA: NYN domain-containing protein [Candidatus Paceibacterota bacterium]
MLDQHLSNLLKNKGSELDEASILLIGRHLKRVRFYRKLNDFGYSLFLKPVKLYEQEDGLTKRKANCDVDMAFHLMREKNNFDRVIILSGDGDFLPVLKYLKKIGKEVLILSRGPRTAKEIKQFAGSNFRDFEYLETKIALNKS